MLFSGSTSGDEMCNLYLMYYTDRDLGSESGGCWQEMFPELTRHLPHDSDTPLPPNPLLEEHAHGENKHKVSKLGLFRKNTVASPYRQIIFGKCSSIDLCRAGAYFCCQL